MEFLVKLAPDWVKEMPTFMDYEGQRRAERTFQVIIVLFAAVGFTWGYICQQFSQTMYILAAGFILSCVVGVLIKYHLTLPPWPMYRVKPLEWQKARPLPDENEASQSSGSVQGKGKKKK